MGRPRTGSVWYDKGRCYARVTWTDGSGIRRDRKRRVMDETHAKLVMKELLLETRNIKRRQPNRAKRYRRDGVLIYCIQILDGHTNPIKIGTSCNIPKRIKMVLTHQPHEAHLLGAWPGSVRDERAVHAMFAESHLAREWFRPTPELLEYIASKTEAKAA